MKSKHNYGNSGMAADSGRPTTRNDQAAWGRLTDSERARWQEVYDKVLAQTHDKQLATLAAWGALNRARLMGVRSGSSYIVRGWASRFDDGSMPDAYDTFWDQDTQYYTGYYVGAPLWMEHGMEDAYGSEPIGKRLRAVIYPFGLMLEHVLHEDHPLFAETVRRIESGEYSYSVDGVGHHTRIDETTGHVDQWFLGGTSLTRYPAEPGLGPVTFAEAMRAMRSIQATHKRGNMNILEMMVAFFGLEEANANEDTVRAEMETLIEALQQRGMGEGEGGEEEQRAVDMTALLMALGLPEGASVDEVIAALQAILAEIAAPAPEGEAMSVRSYNFDALRQARTAAAQTAPPVRSNGLNRVPERREEQPGSRQLRHAPNINRGAKLPGIAQMIRAHMSGGASKVRALGYTTGPTGGYLLHQEVSAQMIELFRAQAVVMQLGASEVPMRGVETMTVRKQKGAMSAYYRGEGKQTTQSDSRFGVVTLNLKELVAATRYNRRLLMNADEALDRIIQRDLQSALELRADLACLRGTGGIPSSSDTGAEPRGIRNTTGVTVTELGSGNGAKPSVKTFVDAWGRIEDANVPSAPTWGTAFSPRTKRFMENLTDTTGNLLDVARWSDGYPYMATTQIPNTETVGTSADCSEVYMGDWQYLMVGIGQDITIKIDESIYVREGEIYIEAAMMHDCGVAQPDAFEVLTGVRA